MTSGARHSVAPTEEIAATDSGEDATADGPVPAREGAATEQDAVADGLVLVKEDAAAEVDAVLTIAVPRDAASIPAASRNPRAAAASNPATEELQRSVRNSGSQDPHAASQPFDGRAVAVAVEEELRRAAGLSDLQDLHPAPKPFGRQVEAVACARALVASGRYKLGQVGVFAREFSRSGARQFLVDTYAGLALASAPTQCHGHAGSGAGVGVPAGVLAPQHLYEVILEGRPCWLYFDLEFSRSANPEMEPEAAAAAFRETLSAFCAEVLGAPLDMASVLELDSTTAEKFSRHVIVKRLQTSPHDVSGRDGDVAAGSPQNLAFGNNAQAGLVVEKLLEFARGQRQVFGSPARLLFARPASAGPPSPPASKSRTPAAAEAVAPPLDQEDVPVVDATVYSRNRCFRLLFSSKFGKNRPLLPAWEASRGEHPALQLLRTMASFVPDDTPLLRHKLISEQGLDHNSRRAANGAPEKGSRPQQQRCGSLCGDLFERVTPKSGLLQHLVAFWDQVRALHEPPEKGPPFRATSVQRSVQPGAAPFQAITLSHNRFCLRKGASHKANHVYIVVDHRRGVFYQKCHDRADCPNFRSNEFPVPPYLLEEAVPTSCDRACAGPSLLKEAVRTSCGRAGAGPSLPEVTGPTGCTAVGADAAATAGRSPAAPRLPARAVATATTGATQLPLEVPATPPCRVFARRGVSPPALPRRSAGGRARHAVWGQLEGAPSPKRARVASRAAAGNTAGMAPYVVQPLPWGPPPLPLLASAQGRHALSVHLARVGAWPLQCQCL